MTNNAKPMVIAIVCVIASAFISGIYVYARFHPVQTKIADVAYLSNNLAPTLVVTPVTTTSISPTENSSPITTTPNEIKKAMETLDSFNKYLHDGEYDKAVELFDWDSFPDPQTAFEEYYVAGNNIKTFENICKNPTFCLRFHKILKTRKASDTEYWFTIQYQTKDGQIYVNSAHISGTFVKNTDFLYSVKKRNGVFKVAELPNGFNVEAE